MADLDGFFYSPQWDEPITTPVLFLQSDASPLLSFPFLNAGNDAYLATIRGTQHGNFCDLGLILEESPTTSTVVDGEEYDLSVLGPGDPMRVEVTVNALLLDFFGKYLRSEPPRILDGGPQLAEATIRERS